MAETLHRRVTVSLSQLSEDGIFDRDPVQGRNPEQDNSPSAWDLPEMIEEL